MKLDQRHPTRLKIFRNYSSERTYGSIEITETEFGSEPELIEPIIEKNQFLD